MLALLYFGLLVLFYLVAKSLYSWYRLRHIPGPPSAGFSKWWLFKRTWRGTMYIESAEACFKYGEAPCQLQDAHVMEANLLSGSLCRIGPNELITSDPEVLRIMGAVRSPYRRSDWYDALRVDRDNILSERNEERHAMLRSKMAPGVLENILPKLDGNADRSLVCWKREPKTRNVHRRMYRSALYPHRDEISLHTGRIQAHGLCAKGTVSDAGYSLGDRIWRRIWIL